MNERSFYARLRHASKDMSYSKAERVAKKRQEIIQSAHKLFIQQGFHGTSMRQIASEAKIALGGLYNHFDSKEAVFEAVFREYHPYKEVLAYLLNLSAVDSIESFIRLAMHHITQAVAHRPEFLNLFFIELVEFQNIHMQGLLRETLPMIENLIARLLPTQKDELRPIPIRVLILSFWGMMIGYFFTNLVFSQHKSFPEPTENADYLVEIFLHGILQS